jgi:predicted permease
VTTPFLLLREFAARLRGAVGLRRADRDLEQELRAHLELAGEAAGAAGRRAGVAQAMEALRDQRGLPWIADFARDLRHGGRLLRRNPVFAAVAVLSLALGIGAASAIFSLADELVLRPLPVPAPDRIVTVDADLPDEGFAGGGVSYPNYRDLRDRARSFDGLLAYRLSTVAFSPTREAAREMRIGTLVSDNFFTVLGVQPALGRSFSPGEGRVPGRDAVVVLSDDFWRSAFDADPSVVDRIVWFNGIPFQVIGVTPPAFTGLEWPVRPAFYVAASMAARLRESADDTLDDRGARVFSVKGRLRAGSSRQSAQAEMATIWSGLARQFPEANGRRQIAVRTELEARVRSDPWDAVAVGLLGGLVALVLVIACANVASLMLGRMRARAREMAIRLALGVSRSRLLRQLLAESVLLALLGCGAGLLLALGGIRFLQTFPVGDQIVIAPELDARVVLFAVLAAAVSALLFGLAPARECLSTSLVPALKSSEAVTRRRRTLRRHVLVVAQVAMSMVLLVATGMFVDAFRKAIVLDPGFRTDHLMMLSLDTSLVRYTPERTRSFYRDLIDRVQALPGVRAATLTSVVPFQPGYLHIEPVVPDGYQLAPGQESIATLGAVVDDRYFDTMQINVIGGRAFTAGDTATTRAVAMVNEEFARRYWPGQDPIGKRMRLPERRGQWVEVVGVTRTGKYMWIAEEPTPFFYLPFAQQPQTRMSLFVESRTPDASALAGPLRDIVRAIDVNQPIANLRTYEGMYRERAVKMPSIVMKTIAAMGLLGLTLALVGLYGLVSYSVARRTREIGIRMAIGAGRPAVRRLVLKQGLALALAGVAIGGVASVAVARALTAALAGLGRPNPLTYVIVPLVLLALTALASDAPARRASRVDPLVALRDD